MLGTLRTSGAKLAKQIIKSTPLSPLAKQLYYKYGEIVGKRHPIQNTNISENHSLVRLGTEYGGWVFVDEQELYNSTIISAGLGEDASFDVEFVQKYNNNAIIVDPTPRAIRHFEELKQSIDTLKNKTYTQNGQEPIEAYDLSNLDGSQLILIKKALWNEHTKIKFINQRLNHMFLIQSLTGNMIMTITQTISKFKQIQSRQ